MDSLAFLNNAMPKTVLSACLLGLVKINAFCANKDTSLTHISNVLHIIVLLLQLLVKEFTTACIVQEIILVAFA